MVPGLACMEIDRIKTLGFLIWAYVSNICTFMLSSSRNNLQEENSQFELVSKKLIFTPFKKYIFFMLFLFFKTVYTITSYFNMNIFNLHMVWNQITIVISFFINQVLIFE